MSNGITILDSVKTLSSSQIYHGVSASPDGFDGREGVTITTFTESLQTQQFRCMGVTASWGVPTGATWLVSAPGSTAAIPLNPAGQPSSGTVQLRVETTKYGKPASGQGPVTTLVGSAEVSISYTVGPGSATVTFTNNPKDGNYAFDVTLNVNGDKAATTLQVKGNSLAIESSVVNGPSTPGLTPAEAVPTQTLGIANHV
jgi:hypothetical protein